MNTKLDAETVLARGMMHLFELDPGRLVEEARLYEDLDIDSIDAVNLIIELRRVTGVPVPPERFREARTVGDVLDVLRPLLEAHADEVSADADEAHADEVDDASRAAMPERTANLDGR